MLLVPLLVAAQKPPVIVPTRIGGDAVVPGQALLTWTPGEVRCDGEPALPRALRRPLNALAWPGATTPPVTYRFAIDAEGRPHAIERATTGYVTGDDDIGPALAASRFAADAPRRGCAVTYAPRRYPLDEAPVEELTSYSLDQRSGTLPQVGWDRIVPPGAGCRAEPRPAPLLSAFPDFRRLPGTPGARDWTMVGYDLDHAGRPVRLRHITGTGNAALDRAGIAAMERSRFTPGDRTGCRYPYWRAPLTLPAPPSPDLDAMRPVGSTCPTGDDWVGMPPLRFPENYRRRAIEGWAIVGFDVAPWGQTGNVRVLASEPTADFGTAAVDLIRGATKAVSRQGRVDCVERVRFVMGTPQRPAPEPPPQF